MQKTEQYQLNLIETSDPISPEPINENTRAVETRLQAQDGRLGALEGGLSAETQARAGGEAALRSEFQGADAAMEQRLSAADTAMEQRLSAADAAMEQRLSAAVSAGDAALDGRIAQARAETAFVHVLGPVSQDSYAALDVNLAGVDMDQYQALVIFASVANGTISAGDASVSVNSATSARIVLLVRAGKGAMLACSFLVMYDFCWEGANLTTPWSSVGAVSFTNCRWANVYGIKA